MKNPFHTPFFTVFQNEVLLNTKRVAPYVLVLLFIANAVLWWIRPAVQFGWATNSDWYIVRNCWASLSCWDFPVFYTGNNLNTILIHRLYCIVVAGACLALAHLFFQRKSNKR